MGFLSQVSPAFLLLVLYLKVIYMLPLDLIVIFKGKYYYIALITYSSFKTV